MLFPYPFIHIAGFLLTLPILLKTRLGIFRPIHMKMSVLPDSRYGFRFITLIRDITEEYDREQENIHSQKQEAIGRLVGGVAHDYNNRLISIKGFSQLLTLSRKRPIQYQLLNFSDLTNDPLPLLEKTFRTGVVLSLDGTDEPLTIMDYIYSLKSLANLKTGRSARLSVSDREPGIREELSFGIFYPFFTTKEEGKSTGLGLSTVKEIIEKYGGEVTVANLPEQGCRITLIFPLVNKQEGY